MQGSYLGPAFSQSQIENALKQSGAVFETVSEKEMVSIAALRSQRARQLVGFKAEWNSGRELWE